MHAHSAGDHNSAASTVAARDLGCWSVAAQFLAADMVVVILLITAIFAFELGPL